MPLRDLQPPSEAADDALLPTRHDIGGLAFPRSALRVLAACASPASSCPDLPFRDRVAERVFEAVGGREDAFNPSELACTAFRALLIDRLARLFFARHPDGLGVGVWSMLGTRAHRVGSSRWTDVDTPSVAHLRRQLVPRRNGWTQLEACFCHGSWLDALDGQERRPMLFILDESPLPLPLEVVSRFFDQVSARAAPGTELVVAFDAQAPLLPSAPRLLSPALELGADAVSGGDSWTRYPRLRWIDDDDAYPDDIGVALTGVNVVAQHYGGSVPALAHLRVW